MMALMYGDGIGFDCCYFLIWKVLHPSTATTDPTESVHQSLGVSRRSEEPSKSDGEHCSLFGKQARVMNGGMCV